MDTKQLAIHVEGLNKVYRLYDHNRDRLIDSLGLARKKRYREHFALNNVDLDVHQGECVGIIGTNGSGKSTLLHMLGGLDTPTEGDVIVRGKRLGGMKGEELTVFRRRNVGFVFQNYNLMPILSVKENITLPLKLEVWGWTGTS